MRSIYSIIKIFFFRHTTNEYPIITILISSGLLFIIITRGKKNYRIRLSIIFLLAIRMILSTVS
jgi:hypothetical protein